jgi:hypothetical protein
MNEENLTPETGPDSPAGLRWFVSCRYYNIDILVRLAEEKTATSRAIKRLSAPFFSMPKPNSFQGRGQRERGNDDGTDMNDSGKWGIYGPIMDPGIEPKGGFEDDPASVPRASRLKAEKKKENREIIDHIRSIDLYIRTKQDNKVDRHTVLAEITWDPAPFSGTIVGAVTRGRPSIGKDGVNDNAAPGVSAPADTRSSAPAVKVPSLGRTKVTA